MEELSIEEKAKCYDEIIERAKNTIEVNQTIPDIVECVESLIPELKESKDERTRKEIINYLEPQGDCCGNKERWIAWLEKQRDKDEEILILKDQIESLHAAIKAIKETHRIELEKLGKNTMDISEDTKQKLEDNLNKALEKETPESFNKFLDEQDEQMFKVRKGNWYVCTNTFVSRGKIIAIKGQTYQSQQEDDTITCEDNCLFIDRHDGKASDYFRYWTIQDAKDGDVLAYRGEQWIFIYKERKDETLIEYYALASGKGLTINEVALTVLVSAIVPATKEHREFLFQKMKESGYEWDAEKKELKQESTEWNEEDDYNLQCCIAKVQHDLDNGRVGRNRELLTWLKSLKYKVGCAIHFTTKQEWSKEDYNKIETIACQLDNNGYEDLAEVLRNIRDKYYHSIPQSTWSPSDEQMKMLDEVLNFAAGHENPYWNDCIFGVLNTLIRQLKKLRE